MLARLNRLLHLRFLSKTQSFANHPSSSSGFLRHFPSTSLPSPHPQPLAAKTWSLLDPPRSFSSGGNGDDTWKFTAESKDPDSIFDLEQGNISGSGEVEAKRNGGRPWDENSSVDAELDIFAGMDQEIASKDGGGDVVWDAAEGYKPWSIGGDEEKSDLFGFGEDLGAMEGFEGEGVDEKGRNEEQEKLLIREQELLATLSGNGI